jgi:chemotaxis response regulator CheB
MIRILLADDHDVMRSGLRTILEAHSGWQVCGEAREGREAVRLALELNPDIAVVDLAMPGLDGLEVTRQIKKELPRTEVLIISTGADGITPESPAQWVHEGHRVDEAGEGRVKYRITGEEPTRRTSFVPF